MSTLDGRIRDLIAHAYAYSDAVRWIMDEAGVSPEDVQTADDLARIPVTSKDRLVEFHKAAPPFGGFLTIDPADLPRIFVSPGPIFDPQPPDRESDTARIGLQYIGIGSGDRVLNTFMYHLTPAGILFDEAVRSTGATVIPTGPGNTEMQVTLMMAIQATGYVGTPGFLAIILDKAAEMGIPAGAVPIKKAAFTAEPYTPSQRARFEGEFGMKTTSLYGTADVGLLGYSRDGVRGFCITGSAYLQVCNPETGEPLPAGEVGEIVVTTFNDAYPLIRFGTGDLGALAPEMDAACDGVQQLLGLYGRSGEAIKVRGMFLHPNQIKMAMSRVPEVHHAQAIINRHDNRDVVTLYVEMKPEYHASDVTEAVKQHVQLAARLRVDDVVPVAPGSLDLAERVIRDERAWE